MTAPARPVINLSDYRHDARDRGWGLGWPSCQAVKAAGSVIVTADRSGTRVSVHPRIARLVDLLMDETERRGFLLKKGQTGAYNCRPIGGTKVPSNHSWGLAVDVNWQDNPYTTNLRLRTIPDWMVALWNRYGFAWGGHYSSAKKDFMHFEFLGTPAQADIMTAVALHEISGAGTVPTLERPKQPRRRRTNMISPATIVRDANGNFRGAAKVEVGNGSIFDAAWASVFAVYGKGGLRVAIHAQDGGGRVIARFPQQGLRTVPVNTEFIPGLPAGTRFVTFEGQVDPDVIFVASGVARAAA